MTDPAKAHILIVDDMPTNIQVLFKMLANDYEASFATSGADALDWLARGGNPDLILLDVMMPDLDGYAVCAALKANPATRDIPVIFVTARDDVESELRALDSGGVDFIHKPIDQATLSARVRLHLELRRQGQALRLANAELTRHRDHLEERVHARTLELAEARDRAESANRAKTAFLTTISHELRTPMNAIIGVGHVLARKIQDPGAQEWLAKSQRASKQLLDLIDQILDFSRLQGEPIQLQVADFDLRELVERTGRDMGQRARDKGLDLLHEVDPQLPRWLKGDATRLEQILAHLLGNAIKFSEHGRIGLRIQPMETGKDHPVVRFTVEDQGIGIPAEAQTGLFQLFQLFHQGDNGLARKYGGTGLGLAYCKRLVDLMAGEMGVSSTPGEGSRFWFSVRLPIGEAPAFSPSHGTVLDWTQTRATAHYVDQLLSDLDPTIHAFWNQSRSLLEPILGERFDAFAHALEGFDFDLAQQLLRNAMAATPQLAPKP